MIEIRLKLSNQSINKRFVALRYVRRLRRVPRVKDNSFRMEKNLFSSMRIIMVANICHQLSDNYVDLIDLYVHKSTLLSDKLKSQHNCLKRRLQVIMSICQIIMSTCQIIMSTCLPDIKLTEICHHKQYECQAIIRQVDIIT